MKFGMIIGTVVCTRKNERIDGRKIQLLQPLNSDLKPSGDMLAAIDSVGAGKGEVVLFASGSSARQTDLTKDTPVDAVIMGIVDIIEKEGKEIFRKN